MKGKNQNKFYKSFWPDLVLLPKDIGERENLELLRKVRPVFCERCAILTGRTAEVYSIMINLQDLFLYQVKKEKAPITTCLIKGFQFKGMVDGADGFTAILGSDNKQNPIYKNVISTIPPICAVKLNGRRSVLSFLSLNG